MRIVLVSEWFSERMGYIENCLPKALAALGHEVHVLTSNAQTYATSPLYEDTYGSFLGPPFVACGVRALDGYTLHRLPLVRWRGRLGIRGLLGALFRLRPDVVQTLDMVSLATYQAALAKILVGFRLFTANHVHASVFPLAAEQRPGMWRSLRTFGALTVPGRLIALATTKCYAVSVDAAEIAIRYLGMPARKVTIAALGVDTDVFTHADDDAKCAERDARRAALGFAEEEIVCVYSGRLSADKDPLVLARAVSRLIAEGERYRGLFIGEGPQKEAIRVLHGCVVHPFVPYFDLAPLYRAADVGVWPRQESTSMLDASACGLPLVISDRVRATERISGSGITYGEGDARDLMRALRELNDPASRRALGLTGARRMAAEYSWLAIARRRVADYQRR